MNSTHIERNRRELEAFRLDLKILPFGEETGAHYAEIRRALRQRGTPIGANDLLLAAHARSLGATLVTNKPQRIRPRAGVAGGELGLRIMPGRPARPMAVLWEVRMVGHGQTQHKA